MKYSLSYLVIILLSLSCVGCNQGRPQVGAPWMQKLLFEGPEGPPLFREGWVDGCETGLSATANNFQRHFYRFKQKEHLAQNQEYYTGWKAAYNYCSRYVFQYLRRRIL